MAMIGEILVEKGYVTQQQIDGVMSVKGEGAQVGQVLIQWGLLTQEQLMEALDIQAPPPPPPMLCMAFMPAICCGLGRG